MKANKERIWLEEVHIKNLGPFLDTKIHLHPNYTVVTGANDIGKSVLLQLIHNAVNHKSIGSKYEHPMAAMKSDSGMIIVAINTGHVHEVYGVKLAEGKSVFDGNGSTVRASSVVIEQTKRIPDTFSLCSSVEGDETLRLMVKAICASNKLYGNGMFSKWKQFSPVQREHVVDELNDLIDGLYKDNMPLSKWRIMFDRGHPNFGDGVLNVRVWDTIERTKLPPSTRGSGFHAITSAMLYIISASANLILIDEPERNLHPGAQKEFRDFLIDLSRSKNGPQVVVVTHSPFFIDTNYLDSVRVIKKTAEDGSVIINSPRSINNQEVREELGLTIADSLVFADLVVLVEGKTEQIVLPKLLRKYDYMDNLKVFLEQIVFMSCEGTSAKGLVLILKQITIPVCVLVDGDHQGNQVLNGLKNLLSDDLLVQWPCHEIEGVVPGACLFEAAKELASRNEDDFVKWVGEQGEKRRIDQWPRSKVFQEWFKDIGVVKGKHLVLSKALDIAEDLTDDGKSGVLSLINAINYAWANKDKVTIVNDVKGQVTQVL